MTLPTLAQIKRWYFTACEVVKDIIVVRRWARRERARIVSGKKPKRRLP